MNSEQIFFIADQLTYAQTKGQPFNSFNHVKRRNQIIEQLTNKGKRSS